MKRKRRFVKVVILYYILSLFGRASLSVVVPEPNPFMVQMGTAIVFGFFVMAEMKAVSP